MMSRNKGSYAKTTGESLYLCSLCKVSKGKAWDTAATADFAEAAEVRLGLLLQIQGNARNPRTTALTRQVTTFFSRVTRT